MVKDFFINEVENAICSAAKEGKLGQMSRYSRGSLSVERPKNPEFGDFAINVSSLARDAKIAPPQIAAVIAQTAGPNYSAAGGFVNFKADDKLFIKLIDEVLAQKENFAKPAGVESEKILLEYVSANPTGPFHIGHGRWAAMGSSLANLLKFYGHEVYQEFYINDAGSQIEKLGKSLSIRVNGGEFPTDETLRKNFYPGEYLIPVAQEFLKENAPTTDTKILADFAKKQILDRQKELLSRFKVDFDNFYCETELHDSGAVEKCVAALKATGKIYEKDGAQWFRSSDFGDDQDRVIKKADGSNTYLTADIAYHADKLERGYDRLINIWGADHHGYVARIKASIQALGYDPARLEVLLGQLVNLVINGEQTRMGKRRNMVTLDELIDEVGVDATRFWMIMRNIDTTLDFDIELAKTNSDENPVFYVQYAHARCCSILRNAVTEKLDTATGQKSSAPLTQAELDAARLTSIEGARQLILKIEEYKSIIRTTAQSRQVYKICSYVQELAAEFHSFYNSNRVISEDKELMKSRLALVRAVKTVLRNALEDILAVSAPAQM